MPDFQTFIAILTALLVFLLGIFLKYDTIPTKSTFPNGQDSSSLGLLSRLWSWINSYGGLSDLRKTNADLRKTNANLSKQNARLVELESKLDIVLQSSDTNLAPTPSTDDN